MRPQTTDYRPQTRRKPFSDTTLTHSGVRSADQRPKVEDQGLTPQTREAVLQGSVPDRLAGEIRDTSPERRLLLRELTFNLNGKQEYVLVQATEDGRTKLVIRETLMNALQGLTAQNDRLQATDYRLQTTDHGRQTTDNRPQTTDYRLQTTDYRLQTTDHRLQTTMTRTVPKVLAGLRESMVFFSREAQRYFSEMIRKKTTDHRLTRPRILQWELMPQEGLRPQTTDYGRKHQNGEKSILLTTEVIRKNYGITRSMSVLAAMGYKIFVREDASMKDEKAREAFYRQYHLEGFLESGSLVGVSGNDAEVRQQMESAAKRKLTRENTVMISFKGETPGEAPSDFTQLVLDEEVLGYSANRRADYPVMLLASRLLEDPNALLWKQLGEGVIGNMSGYVWMLHQTPGSLELSEDLIQELMNYHAARESIARAA